MTTTSNPCTSLHATVSFRPPRWKRLVVDLLEEACCLLHRLPGFRGCRWALWSSELDERWGTGRWGAWVSPEDGK